MKKQRKKIFSQWKKHPKRSVVISFLVLFVLYAGIVIWPVRSLVWPMLSGRTLVVLTNEFEARPCGGFASIYGVFSALPPRVELKNIYAVSDKSIQRAEWPLSTITETKQFWDAGTKVNLQECAADFEQYYEFASGEDIDHVLFADFETVEAIVDLYGNLKLEGKRLTGQDLFAQLSRRVADVDRHDEQALATRKTPLADLGKQMIKKAILNSSFSVLCL